jgi:hypothetical protein
MENLSLGEGYVRINLPTIVRATPKALLIEIDGVEVWVPKSACKVHHKQKLMDVKEWVYEKEIAKI